MTTCHYQWLVVNRILPNSVEQSVVHDVLRHYRADHNPYIPVKFSGAAYRFGHSMVRPSYRANLAGDDGHPFIGLIFDSRVQVPDGQQPQSDAGDLGAGFRARCRFVGWQTVDFGWWPRCCSDSCSPTPRAT